MSKVLTARERKALDRLSLEHGDFKILGEFALGIGAGTLKNLVGLKLVEEGTSQRHGQTGYRITPDGWRCMYGKTHEEITASDGPHHPLKVWRWPQN